MLRSTPGVKQLHTGHQDKLLCSCFVFVLYVLDKETGPLGRKQQYKTTLIFIVLSFFEDVKKRIIFAIRFLPIRWHCTAHTGPLRCLCMRCQFLGGSFYWFSLADDTHRDLPSSECCGFQMAAAVSVHLRSTVQPLFTQPRSCAGMSCLWALRKNPWFIKTIGLDAECCKYLRHPWGGGGGQVFSFGFMKWNVVCCCEEVSVGVAPLWFLQDWPSSFRANFSYLSKFYYHIYLAT